MSHLYHIRSFPFVGIAIVAAFLPSTLVSAQAADVPTFERDVRPILKTYCLDCHGGGEKLEGNLDLRLKRFAVKGGETGPAIVPGNASASLLIERIKAGDMPPFAKKVPAEKIPVIEQWIAAGALVERDEPEQLPEGVDITAQERGFWSFQPIRRPTPPQFPVIDSDTSQNSPKQHLVEDRPHTARTPIDAFVLARLRAKGLHFSREADRLSLIRRVTFDLTGLPPAPKEIEQFVNDSSSDAYEKMLERSLQSPQYGERWGRHWLDIAGYADSEGNGGDDTPRPYAYKYRDYVIKSLNADKPFDQFIIEQLAGDELVPQPWTNLVPDQIEKLAATGFLRMGVDGTASAGGDEAMAANSTVGDAIKIFSSSLLGLTVGCAQCHDHKYDPIPQSDYYRLRSVFEPALDPAHWRRPSQRLVLLYTDADRAKAASVSAEVKPMLAEYQAKEAKFIAAALEKQLEKLPEDGREAVREAYNTPRDNRSDVQKKLLADNPSVNINPSQLYLYDAMGAAELKSDWEKIIAKGNEAPAKDYVSVTDEIADVLPVTHLFHRGDHRQPKQAISPGDLTIAAPEGQRVEIAAKDPSRPTSGRRLALARHLMTGQHPLVGRVLANRLWLHHFGRGIVETPGDFGMLGTRPTHPELLDWLADEFACQGWSLKQMHRLIMKSQVYRQSSVDDYASKKSEAACRVESQTTKDEQATNLPCDPRQIDSENALYWHFPLKRVEAEVLRDRMLAASGRLDLTQFGPPVPVEEDPAGQVIVKADLPRRSIYLQVLRTKPISFLTTFDAPVMTVNCERRVSSAGAVQSLMLMNNESVLNEAEIFAKRVRSQTPADFSADLAGTSAARFRRTNDDWQFGYGAFDDATKRVAQFTALTYFSGSAWQGGPTVPDQATGWAMLDATGGHADTDPQRAVIRRWTARRAGILAIVGKLKHSPKSDDGVRGRIVSSRQGLLGEWSVKTGEQKSNLPRIEVEAGESIDFVTDCLKDAPNGSFEWNSQLTLADLDGTTLETWKSAADFHGPPTTTLPQKIAYAWLIAYERPVTIEELEMACEFVANQIEYLRKTADNSDHELVALTSLCQQLFSSSEFLHVN